MRKEKHTNSAVEGTLVSQAPLTVGKMYRRRWGGKSGKGNTFNTSVWRSFLRNERQ
jgi:hypothetical protein